MPGVNIVIEGTATGTATDADGSYRIDARVGDVLLFSFIGYESQRITVTEAHYGAPLNVAMPDDLSLLDEVVVVGYGSQRKSEITAAISSINLSEVQPLATQRVDQMLQGRAAGVLVRNTDGAPGGNTSIRIRGMNSIQGGNNALIVIDGLQGGDLSSLNPDDIESMEVLKDASATAIYGSQGANGVILISTKQGRTGKPRFNYTTDLSAGQLAKKIELLTAAEFARDVNAREMADNLNREPQPIFTEAEIEAFERNGGTDWQDVMYRTAVTQNHQLSMSGGTSDVNYFVSGAYLNQEGILINSGYDRFSVRANVRANFTDWARAGISWAGSREFDNRYEVSGGQRTAIGMTLRFPPVIPVYDENGRYSEIDQRYGNPISNQNPYANAVEPLTENFTYRNDLNGYLEFTLAEGLILQITGGARLASNNFRRYLNTKTVAGREQSGQADLSSSESSYYQNSNILTYRRAMGGHRITATAAAEQKLDEYFRSGIVGRDFLNDDVGMFDLAGSNIRNISSVHSRRVILSGLGRINYDFRERYLLAATYRADGSSVFGARNKWSYFPSVSAGWRVSEERFMKGIEQVTSLMLRASWGKTGNQAISPYQTLARISATGNYPYDGEGVNTGFRITAADNPSLKWETTTQFNIGVDLGLFDGRLRVAADYYEKVTDDLLMLRDIPTHTGLSSIIDNVGSMGNKGFELAVDVFTGGKEFTWSTGANFTANRTTVLDLGDTKELAFSAGGSGHSTNLPFMILMPGQPFGQIRGWGFEGIWRTDQAQEAARYGQLPGDMRYTDVNNDGKINMDDRIIIGNSMPDFIFGFTNRMSYKSLDMEVLIQGVVGNEIFNVTRIGLEQGLQTSARMRDRWTPENQDTDIPAIIDAKTRAAAKLVSTISFPTSSGNTTSRWIEDGSYARLKHITVGYTLPRSFLNKLQMDGLRIYVSATNLLTLTKYSGYDPEVSSFTNSDAQLGTDFYNYPQARTVTMGINASF